MDLSEKDNKWYVRTPELIEEVKFVVVQGKHQKPTFKIITHGGEMRLCLMLLAIVRTQRSRLLA
jgi:hypothetical protein